MALYLFIWSFGTKLRLVNDYFSWFVRNINSLRRFFELCGLKSNTMPVLAVCADCNCILKEYHFASNTNWEQKEFFASRGILFSFKGHLLHSRSFFFSGREGEVEISQHALFIICDRHKLSGGDCWGPASECVCPCLKPKQSLLRHTHTHTHILNSTVTNKRIHAHPLCPQS